MRCAALGVGYAICLIDVYMGMYYNTIIGWAVYYLVASLWAVRTQLPWTSCDNEWNTPACAPVTDPRAPPNSTTPAKEFFERNVLELHKSNGLDNMGPIKPSLALCVFGVFVLVYFSLWKGVRSAGKVVWVTALAPYVVLLILLARGVTLPGATEGIRYYLTPEWHKLYNSKVWIDAASQIFFSLGPGFGTLLALSSYNKFNNNCYRDAIVTSSINCLTSFLAGFVIFSVLGYMAHVQNKSIEEVGLEGPGLVFIVYPEAIATMSGSVFWAIIFFLMLITLGLDSTFGGLEAVTTALCDEYPRALGRHRELFVAVLLLFIYICALPTTTYENARQRAFVDSLISYSHCIFVYLRCKRGRSLNKRRALSARVRGAACIIHAPARTASRVSRGGMYLVDLLNVFGPGLAILFVVFAEAAGVCWVYGVRRFSADVCTMLGRRPGCFWRACWSYIRRDRVGVSHRLCPLSGFHGVHMWPDYDKKVLDMVVRFLDILEPDFGHVLCRPVFLLVLFVFSVLAHEEMLVGEYQYPDWSIRVGWLLTATTVSCIPVYALYKLCITPGTCLNRMKTITRPEETSIPPADSALCTL
ncbi:Sodium-dependent serotonin transporter [Eumeta japonica]|uniref:Sodium-dependent serotonin transporter n=1 Tax=Eumeta variegata TaxID=151549 RepID=A0A4C1VC29_EUMVA|nr:Sodium-dependent serotonin transporter [Eumeta japonica]